MSAVASCDLEAVVRISDANTPPVLAGGLSAANHLSAQIGSSSGSLKFVDSWQAHLAALASGGATTAKEVEISQPVPLVSSQKEARTQASKPAGNAALKLISGHYEPALVDAKAQTGDSVQDAGLMAGNPLRRISRSGDHDGPHRSAKEGPKTEKPSQDENPLAAQAIPAPISLSPPSANSPQISVREESSGKRTSSTENVLHAPVTLLGSVLSDSAFPLAEPAIESLSALDSEMSSSKDHGESAEFRADFSFAIQDSKNLKAANTAGDSAHGEIEIHDGIPDDAPKAASVTYQASQRDQTLQPGAPATGSASSREINDHGGAQLTASRPCDVKDEIGQNSRDAVQAIPQQGIDVSAKAQQSPPLTRANEFDDTDWKMRRTGAVFDTARQLEERSKHASLSLMGVSTVDSTRPLHAEAVGSTDVASVADHTVTTERPTIQETMNALDAGAGNGSRAVSWAQSGRMHAEAGYQDPALGWIGVRAEVSGGAIHATVVPQSSEAAHALGAHLAGMHIYLTENRTPVETLSLAEFGGSAQQSSGQESGRGTHHGAGDQTGQSHVRELPPGITTTIRSITDSLDHGWTLAVARGGTYISVIA